MSQDQKSLDKLCATPTPSNVKWNELIGVLRSFGYELVKNKGSRRKFYHRGKDALISCHEPHPSPDVAKGCVEDVVEHLRKHGFIKG